VLPIQWDMIDISNIISEAKLDDKKNIEMNLKMKESGIQGD